MTALNKSSLHLRVELQPLTENQEKVFDSYRSGKNQFLTGVAGCGKTFLALGLALEDILMGCDQERILIVRSVVPVRDIGFLPGSLREKSMVYEAPYKAICGELCNRGDAYDVLKGKSIVEFATTCFLRGTTIDNTIVIVDECQNMTPSELNTVITRMGRNSRIMICGDMCQTDLIYCKERSGMADFLKIIRRMSSFDMIEFTRDDIVRSDLVREYLIARDDLEKAKEILPLGI